MFPEEASELRTPQSRENTASENVCLEPNLGPLRPLSITSSLSTEADKVELGDSVKVRACLWQSRDKSLALWASVPVLSTDTVCIRKTHGVWEPPLPPQHSPLPSHSLIKCGVWGALCFLLSITMRKPKVERICDSQKREETNGKPRWVELSRW